MILSIVLFCVAALLGFLSHRKDRASFHRGLSLAAGQAKVLSWRLPVAVFSAGLLSQIVPREMITSLLGPETGLTGLAIASFIGALLPGGPMLAFPLALMLLKAGTGLPQLIALLTAWSALTIQRLLIYEAPLLGSSFARTRFLSSLLLPLLAGLLSWLVIAITGWPSAATGP